jgi:Domain of unknown function (DUF4188)
MDCPSHPEGKLLSEFYCIKALQSITDSPKDASRCVVGEDRHFTNCGGGLRDGYHGVGGLFAMRTRVERRTVNLSAYPDLVVIYLGMRVNRIAGIKTLLGFGPKISSSAAAQPDGLLRHETIVYSLFPMHVGMRQYWRDADSLLEWTRSDPHRQWWQSFLKDSGGTGFWHETYFRRGGIEAVYDDVPENIGLMAFAPVVPARGPMFGAAARAEKEFGERPVLSEEELYGDAYPPRPI